MTVGSVAIALLAGILSTLSPCVLPLIPMILGAAASEHRLGPVAVAAGLAASFVAIGLFIATIGFSMGLDAGHFRTLAAAVLIVLGVTLLVPSLQTQFAVVAGPISGWADSRFGGFATTGLRGQLALGLLLGVIWSPCVGPTLGAASMLASRGEDLGQVAFVMSAFGAGAALPLLILGLLSREVLTRWRGRLLDAGKGGKMVLGGVLVVMGALIVSGLDKRAEAFLVDLSPAWLTELTTRFYPRRCLGGTPVHCKRETPSLALAPPKEGVEAVKKAAARHGVSVKELGADWNQVSQQAPADLRMDDKQKQMMEIAKAAKSTIAGIAHMALAGDGPIAREFRARIGSHPVSKASLLWPTCHMLGETRPGSPLCVHVSFDNRARAKMFHIAHAISRYGA